MALARVAIIIPHIFPPQPGLSVTFSSAGWYKALTFVVVRMNNHKTDVLVINKEAQIWAWKCPFHWVCSPEAEGAPDGD